MPRPSSHSLNLVALLEQCRRNSNQNPIPRDPKKHISISILKASPYLIGLHYKGVYVGYPYPNSCFLGALIPKLSIRKKPQTTATKARQGSCTHGRDAILCSKVDQQALHLRLRVGFTVVGSGPVWACGFCTCIYAANKINKWVC